jgi:hypothetical protein
VARVEQPGEINVEVAIWPSGEQIRSSTRPTFSSLSRVRTS